MLRQAKSRLYFPLARYFRFWAGLRLKRWSPRIVLVTGSSGKTTLLHLLEAQIGNHARFSHRANSAFGIPFHILGFPTRRHNRLEWLRLILLAPIKAFGSYSERVYVVEADSDRPGEAAFVTHLIKPEVTIWLTSDKSHAQNFDTQVQDGSFDTIEAAIAAEFGIYLTATTKLGIIGENKLIREQAQHVTCKVEQLSEKDISGYQLEAEASEYESGRQRFRVPAIEPRETGLSVLAAVKVCEYLNIEVDHDFQRFSPPPGRSSLLNGIKGTILIDSSYNAIPDAYAAMLKLFDKYPSKTKWLVAGDMVELGESEARAHEELATEISRLKLDHIILMGPRVAKYTAPKLEPLTKSQIEVFTEPKPALEYLRNNLKGGETVMLKGARFLEGVIEHLLADPSDVVKLCRRELVWEKRRERWGL